MQAHAGYTATFPMPFQQGARIEAVAGADVGDDGILLQTDWHAYPPESFTQPLRFHAQFRRENPCEAFGRNYLLLDAVGRGRFLGFNYGVAVRDDRARWSHAGAENIYVTNPVDAPEGPFAHLRGAGGEDAFGASNGGVLHRPSTHLDQGVPYYAQEDLGPALARHTLAAYRFFEADAIPFGQSLQVRFGSMANDICSTAYWYQEPPHRPFVRMPDCGPTAAWLGAAVRRHRTRRTPNRAGSCSVHSIRITKPRSMPPPIARPMPPERFAEIRATRPNRPGAGVSDTSRAGRRPPTSTASWTSR